MKVGGIVGRARCNRAGWIGVLRAGWIGVLRAGWIWVLRAGWIWVLRAVNHPGFAVLNPGYGGEGLPLSDQVSQNW